MSEDPLDLLTNAAIAILDDQQLKEQFLKILSVDELTGHNRVGQLQAAISELHPPEKVTKVLRLLQNDQLAKAFYQQLSND